MGRRGRGIALKCAERDEEKLNEKKKIKEEWNICLKRGTISLLRSCDS